MNHKINLYAILFVIISFSMMSSASDAFAKKIKVVTTFTIIQDIAQNVAGDAAQVVSITKPNAEIHNYQPTPQDIVRAQGADIILWNGFNLETWFEQFYDNIEDIPNVVVTENITPLSIYQGPYSGKPNPHAWMSPRLGLVYVENIRKSLAEFDPENVKIYNKNAKIYSDKIIALENRLIEQFNIFKSQELWLVTSEGAFSYLAKDYNLKEAFIWPINADQQGSPLQVRKIIDLIRKHKIPVVFSESTISDRPIKQVAKETGARYGGVLYVDSLSDKQGPVPTYLDLLSTTIQTIINGYQGAS